MGEEDEKVKACTKDNMHTKETTIGRNLLWDDIFKLICCMAVSGELTCGLCLVGKVVVLFICGVALVVSVVILRPSNPTKLLDLVVRTSSVPESVL